MYVTCTAYCKKYPGTRIPVSVDQIYPVHVCMLYASFYPPGTLFYYSYFNKLIHQFILLSLLFSLAKSLTFRCRYSVATWIKICPVNLPVAIEPCRIGLQQLPS